MFIDKTMSDQSQTSRAGERVTFGWLKTLAAVVVLFAIMLVSGVLAARADDCAGQCRARHNQCRLQTKGSPSCDGQLQSCLQSCFKPAAKH